MRSRSTCDVLCLFIVGMELDVSISDEKPLHMRRESSFPDAGRLYKFQSQMRSRSTCDGERAGKCIGPFPVSISDEKPLHMRLCDSFRGEPFYSVSISDEKPLHMRPGLRSLPMFPMRWFQSQMRSRSTCDAVCWVPGGYRDIGFNLR